LQPISTFRPGRDGSLPEVGNQSGSAFDAGKKGSRTKLREQSHVATPTLPVFMGFSARIPTGSLPSIGSTQLNQP
jgi:hypothetical protein